MELTALLTTGTRPDRAEGYAPRENTAARMSYLSRLPSVEPGSMSAAYRSFRAQEAQTMLATQSAQQSNSVSEPAIRSAAGMPGAMAAYMDIMAED